MIRNCDVYNDEGTAMLEFFRRFPKYMKPDGRMAYSTPLFALCEWLLSEFNNSNQTEKEILEK